MIKNTERSLRKYLVAAVVAVGLVFGLSACSFFQGESIDGQWTSPTAAKEMYDEAVNVDGVDMFSYSDHSFEEIVTKSEVNVAIKDDKAVFEVLLFVDEEMFFTALKDEQTAAVREELSKLGLNYDELSAEEKAEIEADLSSDDDIRAAVKTTIDEMAKEMSGTYSAEKGYIQTILFKADVDRVAETFDITEVTAASAEDMVKNGESYQYTYKDGKLTLEGEKDADDMVFEKKKD